MELRVLFCPGLLFTQEHIIRVCKHLDLTWHTCTCFSHSLVSLPMSSFFYSKRTFPPCHRMHYQLAEHWVNVSMVKHLSYMYTIHLMVHNALLPFFFASSPHFLLPFNFSDLFFSSYSCSSMSQGPPIFHWQCEWSMYMICMHIWYTCTCTNNCIDVHVYHEPICRVLAEMPRSQKTYEWVQTLIIFMTYEYDYEHNEFN